MSNKIEDLLDRKTNRQKAFPPKTHVLHKHDYFAEFKTDVEKAMARHNLGLDGINTGQSTDFKWKVITTLDNNN